MQEDPAAHLRKQFFEEGNHEMVIVRDIPFSSTCEHHILPFVGQAHVCSIPKGGRITGLSKIARCVMGYSRRLQVQERLCGQVADAMMAELNPLGVLVVMEAEHTCMTMRGVRSAGALTLTSAVRGIFKDNEKTRAEAMRLLGFFAPYPALAGPLSAPYCVATYQRYKQHDAPRAHSSRPNVPKASHAKRTTLAG